ncbi:hypothetical protein SLEP1_g27937 [Rubroshorea leprosula]|uniref:Myb-like domain-containing protein n=1 Tax=Rubroshorea leprosula TaxID=152421 RepID=A0AAV5JRY8_9ROSI|nr:hypothetical protein SLEP1_g27937 [Rubroshorea leprosula]
MKPSSARSQRRQPEVRLLVKPLVRVPESVETYGTASSLPNMEKEQPLDETNDGTQTMKHPRWTREETIVLIQGKNAIEENLLREGQQQGQNEPKWYLVSLYCKQHGVDREAVQCRKRWNTLIGEYKKIKTWESQIREGADSFWVMRAKLKRERKLPNSFDKEVYDAFEGKRSAVAAIPLATEMGSDIANEATGWEEETGDDNAKEATAMEEETGDEVAEAVFDCGHSHAIAEEGLFSNYEQPGQEDIVQGFEKENIETSGITTKTVNGLSPNSELEAYRIFLLFFCFYAADKVKGKNPASSEWTGSMTEDGLKHGWSSLDGCVDAKLDQLIKVLERNGSLINEQIQAQNTNCQLDRDQGKEHTESLIAAINKLTEAVVKIANKLQVKK